MKNNDLATTNTNVSSKNGKIHINQYSVGNFTISAKWYKQINRSAFASFLPSDAKFMVSLRYYSKQNADLTLYQNGDVIYLASVYGGSFEDIYLNVWW